MTPHLHTQPVLGCPRCQLNEDESCQRTYTAWSGLVLHCNGQHLRGNPFRGQCHQASYKGVTWTWYDDEADKLPANRPGEQSNTRNNDTTGDNDHG